MVPSLLRSRARDPNWCDSQEGVVKEFAASVQGDRPRGLPVEPKCACGIGVDVCATREREAGSKDEAHRAGRLL